MYTKQRLVLSPAMKEKVWKMMAELYPCNDYQADGAPYTSHCTGKVLDSPRKNLHLLGKRLCRQFELAV